jgi:hypothetical protein
VTETYQPYAGLPYENQPTTPHRASRRPYGTLEEMVREILDRSRRTETRVTIVANSMGLDTQAQRPVWCEDGSVSIPSMDCSVKDILATIPSHFQFGESEVEVLHKSRHVMWFFVNKE